LIPNQAVFYEAAALSEKAPPGAFFSLDEFNTAGVVTG
jgi:hypothetical protein